MTNYVYESHLGGIYILDEELDYEELYCEECGDYDYELGFYEDNDLQTLWDIVKNETNIFGTGGYNLAHIATFFCDRTRKELDGLGELELLAIIREGINNA